MKVLDYGFCLAKSLDELSKEVHLKHKDDYEPIGGVVINETYHGKEFIQTMVKYQGVGRPKKTLTEAIFGRNDNEV